MRLTSGIVSRKSSILSVFPDSVEHCEHVFNGGFFENCVVAGAGHITPAGHHNIENLTCLFTNDFSSAVDEYVVGVDGAVKEDFVAEFGLECPRVHSLAIRLDGVQTTKTRRKSSPNRTRRPSSSSCSRRLAFSQNSTDAPHQHGTRSGSSCSNAAKTRSRDVISNRHLYNFLLTIDD